MQVSVLQYLRPSSSPGPSLCVRRAPRPRLRPEQGRPDIRSSHFSTTAQTTVQTAVQTTVQTAVQVCVLLGVLLVGILQGCGGPRARSAAIPAPVPRRSVVWLGPEGLDGDTAARLREVGVDEVVIRRGTVDLSGSQPSLRFLPLPPLTPELPVGLALSVTTGSTAPPPEQASTVWNALAATQSSLVPVELLLDMPSVPEGMDVFVSELAAVAGIPVLPVLAPDQIGEEMILRG